MQNIFIHLKSKKPVRIKEVQLIKLLQKQENTDIPIKIKQYFSQVEDFYHEFILQLLKLSKIKQNREKLLAILVYCIVTLTGQNNQQKLLNDISNQKIQELLFLKFLSLTYKSIESRFIKRWVILKTLTLLENQGKFSIFNNFVTNFEHITQNLDFSNVELIEIYYRLITYLQNYLLYKQLKADLIVKCLMQVSKQTAKINIINKLMLVIIKQRISHENAIILLSHPPLKNNELYPLFEICNTGNLKAYQQLDSHKLSQLGVDTQKVLKKIKIQSIPRLLANSTIIGYSQFAQLLQIKKEQVESFIIEAMNEGIIKAKFDQFEETILINGVNFKCLRKQERNKLQKDVTTICQKLETIVLKN